MCGEQQSPTERKLENPLVLKHQDLLMNVQNGEPLSEPQDLPHKTEVRGEQQSTTERKLQNPLVLKHQDLLMNVQNGEPLSEKLKHIQEASSPSQGTVDKFHALISYLGTIGGKDLKASVWNILTRLDNSVAKQVNWKGINSKRSFRNMDLKTVILSAVRKNPLNEKASDIDIERHIIRWFNLSGDRAGGRKNRERNLNM